MADRTYQPHEFAKRAGVTIRALHHYDRLGLLKPSGRTAAGYRRYTDRDLVRLEQVVALKFIGFLCLRSGNSSVEKISTLLPHFGINGRSSQRSEIISTARSEPSSVQNNSCRRASRTIGSRSEKSSR